MKDVINGSAEMYDEYLGVLKEKAEEFWHGNIAYTMLTYERILSAKHPGDCIALYTHYLFASRRQKTNSVWANRNYSKKGLGWGSDKVKRTNEELEGLGLIKIRRERDKKGKYEKRYIEIKYIPTIAGLNSSDLKPTVDKPTVGNGSEKCLKNKSNNTPEQAKLEDLCERFQGKFKEKVSVSLLRKYDIDVVAGQMRHMIQEVPAQEIKSSAVGYLIKLLGVYQDDT